MKKRMFIIAIISIMLMGICAVGFADEVPPVVARSCLNCDWYTAYVCRDQVVRTETATHGYGWLNKETCTVIHKFCYSDWKCLSCGLVYESKVGPHHCYEDHKDCGRGLYHVCTIEYNVP